MIVWENGFKKYRMQDITDEYLLHIAISIERKKGNPKYLTKENLKMIYDELYLRGVIGYFKYISCRMFGGKLYGTIVFNKKNCEQIYRV